MTGRPDPAVTLRPLTSPEDFAAGVELQRATWGESFAEAVPGSILKICQKVGGVAAGAFAAGEPGGDGGAGGEERLLGFVFGLTGVRYGRLAHWSHMLAVLPAARDLGLGTRLKLYQRDLLLPLGVESVYWSFDPLEARNAHLNLHRLGGEIEEYVEEMYADEMGSELAKGIGTDRLIVDWQIGGERVRRALAGELPPGGERFGTAPVAPPAALEELPEAPWVRIEVPANIQERKAENLEEAVAWRAATRRAFESYLGRGYRVETFYRDRATGRCFYGLEKG
ncbi:MAG TPA: hypothetical protein VFE33_17655 [Thermoanaerobaculia bacterium]|nr:hypothetical protein [Thermoanaerobaculia bacterium]